MRKILTALLVVSLLSLQLVSSTSEALADVINDNGENGDNEYTLDINHVTAQQEITYGWDLVTRFVGDHTDKGKPSSALFQVEASRSEVVNELTMSVEAKLNQAINVDSLTIELGDLVDDSFVAVETYVISELNIATTDEGVTIINFNITIDLLGFDEDKLDSLKKIRLLIPVENENGHIDELKTTHGFSFDTVTVNEEAEINANLLEALGEYGTTDTTVENLPWIITSEDLDEDNLFQDQIQINFNEIKEVKDIIVTVVLTSGEEEISNEVTMTFGQGGNEMGNEENGSPDEGNGEGSQELNPNIDLVEEELLSNIWYGDIYQIQGFWLPPVSDNFVLGKRSKKINFCLESVPAEALSLGIFETAFDDLNNRVMGQLVYEITQEDLKSPKCNKRSKSKDENLLGSIYKCALKTRELPVLENGKTYVLGVMIGDKLLAFDEDSLAILHFTLEENVISAQKIRRSDSNQTPKFANSKY